MKLSTLIVPVALIAALALFASHASAQTMGEYATVTAGAASGSSSMGTSISNSISGDVGGGSSTWSANGLGASFEERAGAGSGGDFESRAGGSRWPESKFPDSSNRFPDSGAGSAIHPLDLAIRIDSPSVPNCPLRRIVSATTATAWIPPTTATNSIPATAVAGSTPASTRTNDRRPRLFDCFYTAALRRSRSLFSAGQTSSIL